MAYRTNTWTLKHPQRMSQNVDANGPCYPLVISASDLSPKRPFLHAHLDSTISPNRHNQWTVSDRGKCHHFQFTSINTSFLPTCTFRWRNLPQQTQPVDMTEDIVINVSSLASTHRQKTKCLSLELQLCHWAEIRLIPNTCNIAGCAVEFTPVGHSGGFRCEIRQTTGAVRPLSTVACRGVWMPPANSYETPGFDFSTAQPVVAFQY